MSSLGIIIKIMLIVILIMAGLYIFLTCSSTSSCLINKIDKTMPNVDEAPYLVTTRTHLYYAEQALSIQDGSVIIKNWYDYVKDKWVYHEGSVELPAILAPKIERR